mgnify:CR=1 FL=1
METISITFKASDIGEVTLENVSCVEYGTSENNLKKVEGAALATHRFEMGYNLYHIIGKGLNVTFSSSKIFYIKVQCTPIPF